MHLHIASALLSPANRRLIHPQHLGYLLLGPAVGVLFKGEKLRKLAATRASSGAVFFNEEK
jgi:hypothetical protein